MSVFDLAALVCVISFFGGCFAGCLVASNRFDPPVAAEFVRNRAIGILVLFVIPVGGSILWIWSRIAMINDGVFHFAANGLGHFCALVVFSLSFPILAWFCGIVVACIAYGLMTYPKWRDPQTALSATS
jgi:hypothetical protein